MVTHLSYKFVSSSDTWYFNKLFNKLIFEYVFAYLPYLEILHNQENPYLATALYFMKFFQTRNNMYLNFFISLNLYSTKPPYYQS